VADDGSSKARDVDSITAILRRNREQVLSGAVPVRPRPLATPWLDPPSVHAVDEDDLPALLDHDTTVAVLVERYGLTRRESDVLALLLLGRDNLAIATVLRVKLRTAKTHVEHIWEKTGARSRAQLMGLLFGEEP
jgi:DNA-binding NarL/FixJ family response regulator